MAKDIELGDIFKRRIRMNTDRDPAGEVIESSLTEAVRTNDSVPLATHNPSNPPRKKRRKPNKTKPLYLPEDEAIAQYLSAPKSVREFNSFDELTKHFGISRMTVYRRTKDLIV